ncbi:TPA: hypothetical protein DIT23_04500 [candidate division WOR-3 bacterium]|nr:hypothetical protein [candidate division WOR-3 bacterium]
MKKYFFLFLIFAFFIISYGRDYCPFDKKDDPYPGMCGRYTDENNDSICDLSQDLNDSIKGPTLENEKVEDLESNNEIKTFEDENLKNQENTPQYENKDIEGKDDETFKIDVYNPLNYDKVETKNIKEMQEENYDEKDRYFLFIFLPLFLFLFFLIFFSKRKKVPVDVCDINRIINILLIIDFIPVLFTSAILVLREYGILNLKNISKLVYMHNLAGVIFVLLMLLHIYIKLQYYILLIKNFTKRGEK